MKHWPRLPQKLLCMTLVFLLTFAATGLADDPSTPTLAPSLEPTAPAGPGDPVADPPLPEEEKAPVAAAPFASTDDTLGLETDTLTPDTDTPAPSADAPAPDTDTLTPEGTDTPIPATDTPEPAADTPLPTQEETPPPPACLLPDCPHIAADEQGNPIALCPLGEWMLAQPLPMALGISPMAAILPTNITLPATGSYTLYRSGTYTLTGGGPDAKLIVSENCLVALTLENAQLGTLALGSRCVAEITFQGSAIGSLSLPQDASVKLLGQGSLTVGSVGPNIRDITIRGGSVSMPAGIASLGGAVEFTFSAPGSTGATVNGQPYPYTQPCPDHQAHLWLPALEGGRTYAGHMNGSILEITLQEPAPTPSDSYDLAVAGIPFAPRSGDTLTLLQSGPALPQLLRVDATPVTLMMSSLDAASAPVDLTFLQDGSMHLTGSNTLGALGGTAKVTLTGSGSLTVASLGVGSLSVASGLTLAFDVCSGTALGSWYPLAVPVALTAATKATLDGKPIALAFSTADPSTALLPQAPAAEKVYSAALEGDVLALKTIPQGERLLVLTDSGLLLDQDGTYQITTQGPTSGSLTIAPSVRATVAFLDLDSSGSLQIGRYASIALSLRGSSALGGGIALAQGSALAVQGGGALLTAGIAKSEDGLVDVDIKSPANLTLPAPGPIAGTGLKPTVLFISDPTGAALPNTSIVLKLGKSTPFSITTDRHGMIYLWRSDPLSSVDAVVLSDANTYATVLMGGSGDPDALPEITGVSVGSLSAITYTATGAATSGVQYYINRPGVNMPDTYMAEAGRVLERFGECNIPGLGSGDLVIFRVYACAKADVALSADTADGFAFSDQYSFVASDVRFPFSLEGQHKTYNGKKFSFDSGLIPMGAAITWFSGSQQLSEAPVKVGRYTAKISIPPGHPDFLPGVTAVSVEIVPIVVLISPQEARKVMGEPDPAEFSYTYDRDAMLSGDRITGLLTRLPGEMPGNYPYFLKGLEAKAYYRLEMDPDAPMFFIDFDPRHFTPYDPLARIDPVHDVIVFSDGRKLDLITATVQKLNISGVGYGEMITQEASGKGRPFTPSLRLRPGYDAALLILQAEPELRQDGGYVTDADGNPVVTGRTLTLTYTHLEHLRRQRITHIAFGLQGAFCYLDLSELKGEALQAFIAREGLSRQGARFAVTLTPVTGSASLTIPSAQDSAALQALVQVRLEVVSSSGSLDITPALPSARLLMDVSPALDWLGREAQPGDPDVEETVLGQPRQTQPPTPWESPQTQAVREAQDTLQGRLDPTVQNLELARQTLEQALQGCSLGFFADLSYSLDSHLVVPYTFAEAQAIPYTAILRTKPYLMAPLTPRGNGLYGLILPDPSTRP